MHSNSTVVRRTQHLSKLILVLCMSCVWSAKAQNTIRYNIGVHSFCDNREYTSPLQYQQTIFGTRVSPTVQFTTDTFHRFTLGLNALKEFGGSGFVDVVQPVAYYTYSDKKVVFNIGAFPRKNLLDTYPRALLTDTLHYYRPNVEGMLFQFQGKWGHETVWIDWVGKQSITQKEAFLYGIAGRLQKGIFFVDHYSTVFHQANALVRQPTDRIIDYYAGYVRAGIQLAPKNSYIDSVAISVGTMGSVEVIRSPFVTRKAAGFLAEACIERKGAGIKEAFYMGNGHRLNYGDAFYKGKTYSRTDFYFTPLRYKNISGRFIFSLHYSEQQFDNQQAFLLNYTFGGSIKK